MCNHSCIRQELACYTVDATASTVLVLILADKSLVNEFIHCVGALVSPASRVLNMYPTAALEGCTWKWICR